MCGKITIIDRQHRNAAAIMATKPKFLVAKDEMLDALATVLVAILSLGWLLRTYARTFSNIDFFLRLLPLKVDELVISEV